MWRKVGLATREMVSDILSLSAQIQVLWVDAILAVALVLNLRACGDSPAAGVRTVPLSAQLASALKAWKLAVFEA